MKRFPCHEILLQTGESVTVYCVPSHTIAFAFCFSFPLAINFNFIVLSLQLQWAAKFILVNHPQ